MTADLNRVPVVHEVADQCGLENLNNPLNPHTLQTYYYNSISENTLNGLINNKHMDPVRNCPGKDSSYMQLSLLVQQLS